MTLAPQFEERNCAGGAAEVRVQVGWGFMAPEYGWGTMLGKPRVGQQRSREKN